MSHKLERMYSSSSVYSHDEPMPLAELQDHISYTSDTFMAELSATTSQDDDEPMSCQDEVLYHGNKLASAHNNRHRLTTLSQLSTPVSSCSSHTSLTLSDIQVHLKTETSSSPNMSTIVAHCHEEPFLVSISDDSFTQILLCLDLLDRIHFGSTSKHGQSILKRRDTFSDIWLILDDEGQSFCTGRFKQKIQLHSSVEIRINATFWGAQFFHYLPYCRNVVLNCLNVARKAAWPVLATYPTRITSTREASLKLESMIGEAILANPQTILSVSFADIPHHGYHLKMAENLVAAKIGGQDNHFAWHLPSSLKYLCIYRCTIDTRQFNEAMKTLPELRILSIRCCTWEGQSPLRIPETLRIFHWTCNGGDMVFDGPVDVNGSIHSNIRQVLISHSGPSPKTIPQEHTVLDRLPRIKFSNLEGCFKLNKLQRLVLMDLEVPCRSYRHEFSEKSGSMLQRPEIEIIAPAECIDRDLFREFFGRNNLFIPYRRELMNQVIFTDCGGTLNLDRDIDVLNSLRSNAVRVHHSFLGDDDDQFMRL